MKGIKIFAYSKSNKILSQIDFEGICHLLKNGFTIAEILLLLKDRRNQHVFEEIQFHLQNGEEVGIFFEKYCPKKYRNYFGGFIKFLPFAQSAELTLDIVKVEQVQRKELIRQLYYPVLLFLFTLFGMVVFNRYCFPSLLNMMIGFRINDNRLILFHHFISFLSIAFLLILVLILSLLIYFQSPSKQVRAYKMISGLTNSSLIVEIHSLAFILFFLQCIKIGTSTKESMAILKSIPNKPVVHFLASGIEEIFVQGEAFTKAFSLPGVDRELGKFIQIAVLSSDIEEMLSGYIQLTEAKISRKLKSYAKLMQIISYCMIGLILVLVYQILLLPMTLIQKL